MGELIKKNTVISCWIIFAVLITVHGFEAIVLKMDETVFGENFINKLFGIGVVFIVLRSVKWKWTTIGFAKTGLVRNLGLGLLVALCSFVISYGLEIMVLKSKGHDIRFGFFTTGFSLTGETAVHTGFGFILMCIFFNIINVVMEEGTFRGLFYHIASIDHSREYALLFQAFLFGVWHIVTPLHNLIDGDINIVSFLALSAGYIILAGLMGIKWGLLYRMTGSLYAGMADHFFNNCVATNLLHVVTENGIDEMMILRVAIAQLCSFAVIVLMFKRGGNAKDGKER
ncbi:MAG: CPBP family intramembrane metalloprotease [Lachnospiraceae bacterium]|nr:CPBP family intramembrane metalloprotease [Lachnospiraceae bacterium]